MSALAATAAFCAWPVGAVENSAFIKSPWFDERTLTTTVEPDVRVHVNAPNADPADAGKPVRVIVYALPNGNTLEQTLGCRMAEGMDWHYDIQHVAAQVRLVRSITPGERIVLVCAEAGGLSWPAWRAKHKDANQRIADLVADWRTRYGGPDARVTLTGHSGGGGFMFSVVEAGREIPDYVDRIAFLDANYNFDAETHADRFAEWLRGDPSRRLIVLAYDDREITLGGKKVVGPTGGTFRATGRMVDAFRGPFSLREPKSTTQPFIEHVGLGGRVHFYVHPNPDNKILHTALVGDMNGLVHALTLGTPQEAAWGKFGGPRAYEKFIQPEPTPKPDAKATGRSALPRVDAEFAKRFPPRPAGAPTGSEFCKTIARLNRQEREAAIYEQLAAGNFPEFERNFVKVAVSATLPEGKQISGVLSVMPDCQAVGSDADWVRMPMTPQTAQRLADKFDCVLPTRKMVDAMDAAATVRLAPQPLTEDRESVAAFVLAHEKTEKLRAGQPLGALVAGAKKDLVLSPRIFEKPDRVVIYGWRQLNGQPIQPLTNVHVNWYVDYSHGVRLVRDTIEVGDERVRIEELLVDPQRCSLVSDEGVIDPPRYPVN